MEKQFVRRPLVLFASGYALGAIITQYLTAYAVLSLIGAGILAVVLAVLRLTAQPDHNLRQRRIAIALAGVIIGILWWILYDMVLEEAFAQLSVYAANIGIFTVPQKIAEVVGNSIDNVFHERVAPFIRAITIGDAAKLKQDSSVYAYLKISGIAHIVAVSGMHVTFLLSMISPFIRGRRRRAAIAIPLLFLFMAVSGFSPSVSRAVIMHSFVLLAPLTKRRSDGATNVFAALLLLLIVNPQSITSTGLQLSFLSTLGLVLFSRKIEDAFTSAAARRNALQKPVISEVCGFVLKSLARTLAALSLSLPLTAYYFGYVAIFAPVTNLITLWAASFAFCGGFIAAGLGIIWQPLGLAAAAIASIPTDWIIFAAQFISNIPFSAVYVSNIYILGWIVYLYLSIVLLVVMRGKLRAALWTAGGAFITLVFALLLTSLAPSGGLEIAILDVGQGQSLVATDGVACAVIDCGGSRASEASLAVASYLQELATSPADLLILTHFHADHAGGVPELLALERFNTLIIPDPALGDITDLENEIISLAVGLGIDIIVVTETVEIRFGSSVITIYPPFGGADENEACLTVLISDGGWDALITGDMPSSLELLLLEYIRLPDVELFIAGHHGSKYSNSRDLLEEIRPEIVVISVAADNSYGHPADETLSRFADLGAGIYRTDISGTITVKSGG